MKLFQVVLTISLGLSAVLPVGGYEACQKNYLGSPFLSAVCKNYCCGSTNYQYCCSQCSYSLYSSDSCGLSAQVIAGIVVGCIAFVILVAVLVLLILYLRKKKRREIHASPMDNDADSTASGSQLKGISIFASESSSTSEMIGRPTPPPSYTSSNPTVDSLETVVD